MISPWGHGFWCGLAAGLLAAAALEAVVSSFEKVWGMKLWFLERVGGAMRDSISGYVIRAEDEYTARQIANLRPWDEGPIWLDPAKATCVELRPEGDPGVILCDSATDC